MICPNCKNHISADLFCKHCNKEVTLYKKILNTSKWLYNQGLAKAQIRDLSSSIDCLKRSVRYDKNNIDARNLLGLVYFEMGEVVQALEQWVISKNIQNKNNIADKYINYIQANPTKLATLNQAIKKYNQALIYVNQNSRDLAIIQLRNVVSLNPNFIKAYCLLSLVYIKEKEYDRAKRILKKVLSIDANNLLALKYYNDISKESSSSKLNAIEKTTEITLSEEKPVVKYREKNSNQLVNILIGIVVGIAVSYVLIVPNIKSSNNNNYTKLKKEYNELVTNHNSKVTLLEGEKAELQGDISNLQAEVQKLSGQDDLFVAITYLLEAVDEYLKDNKIVAAEALFNVDDSKLISDISLKLYNTVKEATFSEAGRHYYGKGYSGYKAKKYDEAIENFNKSLKFVRTGSAGADTMYFLARSYDFTKDIENAKSYYDTVIKEYPGTKRATDATYFRGLLGD